MDRNSQRQKMVESVSSGNNLDNKFHEKIDHVRDHLFMFCHGSRRRWSFALSPFNRQLKDRSFT